MPKYYRVPGCTDKRVHLFPTSKVLLMRWRVAVNSHPDRKCLWQPSLNHDILCHEHFGKRLVPSKIEILWFEPLSRCCCATDRNALHAHSASVRNMRHSPSKRLLRTQNALECTVQSVCGSSKDTRECRHLV